MMAAVEMLPTAIKSAFATRGSKIETYLTLWVVGHPLPVQACPLVPCGPYRLTKGQANLLQASAVEVDGPERGGAGEGSRLVRARSRLMCALQHGKTLTIYSESS